MADRKSLFSIYDEVLQKRAQRTTQPPTVTPLPGGRYQVTSSVVPTPGIVDEWMARGHRYPSAPAWDADPLMLAGLSPTRVVSGWPNATVTDPVGTPEPVAEPEPEEEHEYVGMFSTLEEEVP